MVSSKTPLAAEKVVVLFRTCGYLDADGRTWVLPIHAWVYEPHCKSRVQRATLALFRRYLRYKTKSAVNDLFQQRTQAFFVGNQRGLRLNIELGNQNFFIEKTGTNGHVKGIVRIPHDALKASLPDPAVEHGWVKFNAALTNPQSLIFSGQALCLPRTGLSIISDIDDTIKHSHVSNRKELLTNTFLRNFQPVPDAANLYQGWKEQGAQFHYVSSSPWQLHEPLSEFIASAGFPEGSLHLRFFSLRNSRILSPFVFRPENKARSITALLQQYPQRKFVLIGDSGERDPEIYGAATRRFPNQIARIFIRDISNQGSHSRRLRKAFQGAAANRWRLYKDAEELRDEKFLDQP
ncbi:MAG: phosphatase domain-containing protein [Planctomycetota bacterium]